MIIEKRVEILNKMKSETIIYSNDNVCHIITRDEVSISNDLCSNQEEADTKLALHTRYALKSHKNGSVIIRNTSGDVDVNIIMLSLITEGCARVIIDFNKGKDRKAFYLSQVDMTSEEKQALIGFHAFTGNDYISAFFRKGKAACWNILRDNSRFWNVFREVGTEWLPSESLSKQLEEFVCLLFGSRRLKNINEVRYHLFKQKYDCQNKIIDLSLLPPCKSSLQLHILRTCYVARIWRLSLTSHHDLPPWLERWSNKVDRKSIS